MLLSETLLRLCSQLCPRSLPELGASHFPSLGAEVVDLVLSLRHFPLNTKPAPIHLPAMSVFELWLCGLSVFPPEIGMVCVVGHMSAGKVFSAAYRTHESGIDVATLLANVATPVSTPPGVALFPVCFQSYLQHSKIFPVPSSL